MRTLISAAALLVAAGSANATINGVIWRSVNNSSGTGDAFAAGFTPGVSKTFDLFVTGNLGDVVNGLDFGSATTFIEVDGAVFNHGLGADSRAASEPALAPSFHALPFDTFATFGGNAAVVGAFGGFAGAVNMTGAGGKISFTDFAPAGNPAALTADAGATGGASLWVLRVSVTGGTKLGGGSSRVGVGVPGSVLFFNVANALAIPTPGAVALFGLAGIAGVRRRR